MDKCKVIALVNQKGGVAKTTSTVNLGVGLAKKIQGAVMIARPDIMKEVGEQLGCDYYILPSSKHEVLIVPVNAGIDLDVLCWMVQDVNETQVDIQDKLSDKVQYYECESLGVAPVNVYIVQEAVDGALAYYSHNENGIFFSLFFFKEASLEDVLYVSSHEAYHRYEHALIDILNLLDSAGVSSYKSLEYFDEAVSLRLASITYAQDSLVYNTYAQNLLEVKAEEYAQSRIYQLKELGYLK